MTNALAALINAAPERLDRLGVESPRAVASIDAAKFDNRPTWDNRGSFDSRPGWDNWNKKK
ncbi:multiple cyclophane-containing RiPP AmcA [Salinispora fenicalii]|uniref:multiple cyclophane-containing RiPP AmcA n=1 Tax=Salinispora fenicalii TaxID=1137263 RepID=UPI00036CC5C6|nr:multiple cyclophane-containing RiPP AmcA [Salinispora fenicalii]